MVTRWSKYPDVMTTVQVAECLGVSKWHVTKLVRLGLKAFRPTQDKSKKKNRTSAPFRFLKEDVIDYWEKSRVSFD